jgi:peptide/nickel transport system permease protein
LPASLELALAATLLALAISIPAGILSALRRGSWIDHLTTTFVTAGIAMPGFWLAMLIVLIFAVHLNWLPPSGYVSFDEDPAENLRLLILPASTLAILVAAPTMRFLRSSMLNVLSEDYVRTARAKGLVERTVVYRHALRNALIPTVTWIGLQFAYLVGGSVMIEWVFGWPGIGWFALKAVLSRDYVVVQSTVITIAAIFVLVNLAVDLLYAVLDPRVRLS